MSFITAPGAGDVTIWKGGDGTISVVNVDAADKVPNSPGDFNGATVKFQASFDQEGLVWDDMVDNEGVDVVFSDTDRVKNFSLPACKIRPFTTGAPTGVGLRLGINPRK